MPADDTYTTLLNFVSDSSQANREIKTTTENLRKMEEQAKKVSSGFTPAKLAPLAGRGESIGNDIEKELQKVQAQAKRMGITISKGLLEGFRSGDLTDENLAELGAIAKQVEKVRELEEAHRQETQEAIRSHSIKARLYSREAQILTKTAADIRQNAQLLRNQAQQLQAISQLGLGLGVGVVGGIFAFASKYVRDAKVATEATTQWKLAQDSLARSGQRVGEVFAQTALPLLQKAADIAQKASFFVQRHPEIVQAALNTGLIVAGLSAVGLAVSKGIRLYADQLYLSSVPIQLQAGKLQFAAAQEQLLAARIRAGIPVPEIAGGAGKAAGAGGALTTLLGSPAGIVALFLGNAAASIKMADALDQLEEKLLETTKSVPLVTVVMNLLNKTVGNIAPLVNWVQWIKKGHEFLESIREQARNNTGTRGGGSAGGRIMTGDTHLRFGSSEIRERALAAYEDYTADDLQLVQDHYRDRLKITADAQRAEAAENEQYANSATKIRTQLGRSLAEATRNFEQQSLEAEQQLAQQRQQIVRDGGIEIQRMEQDLQERLRKLRMEHDDRNLELLRARDAVGLVKERQRYEQERAETSRQTNIEIGRRRADLALRLQDLQQQFIQERAHRLAEYQARVEEIRANAQQQLQELAERHRAEIAEIRRNKVERIKELDAQFVEERKRRYNQFVQQLRDIDASLLGERALRAKRQAEMLVELDKFLLSYKARLATLQTAPTGRAAGGYASYGTYLLGDAAGGGRGKPEYVLRGDVTELAERVLGGRLSQEKMIALLSAAGSGQKSATYNDFRRIDSKVSNTDRQQMMDDTISALSTVFS